MAFLHNLWPEIVLLLEKANGNFIRRVLGPFFIEIDYWTEVLQFNGGNWKWQLNRENPFLDRCSNLSDCHSTCNFLLISIKKSQFLFIFFPPNGCNRIEFNACREEFSGNAECFVRLLLCIPSEGPHTSGGECQSISETVVKHRKRVQEICNEIISTLYSIFSCSIQNCL